MGQRLLGQERWMPYLALEAWSWVQLFVRRDRGRELQARYRDLAWEVARRVSVGERTDGDFGYYESLTQFDASGAFDRDPLTAGVQPEEDTDTFNGSLWMLARDIFFPGGTDDVPEPGSDAFERAREYYLERAVRPAFAWQWGENSLQREAFEALIAESDDEIRGTTTMIGIIIANHLVSAIDAYVSARLREMDRDPGTVGLIPLGSARTGRWGFAVRIRR